ncbi:acyltransferase family protein [Thiosulfativibrio zosterae]|uniref:acyltransferase family protein n=1 Tax=Thiosulfativibrio zosterae TaxID=2675053 RepID=UPI001566AF3A|nr:acyltransferase [Thiosulfativibrio zosterae]
MALKTATYLQKHALFTINLPIGEPQRKTNIDGLRGFLALGVFYHHFIITYHWKLTGQWVAPAQNFFNNIGQVSVALFFMITGYLFIGRMLKNKLTWRAFFLSRLFRIMPLYLFMITLMTWLILFHSNFLLTDGVILLLKEIGLWPIFQQPSINGFEHTMQVTAGVTWTLKYEWIFYLALPIIGLLLSHKISIWILLLSVLILAHNPKEIYITEPIQFNTFFFILFLIGGFGTHIEIKYKNIKPNLIRLLSYGGILSIILVLFFFTNSYGVPQAFLIGVFFLSILLGNNLFGLLHHRASIILGEMSYSIYLVHGLVLYVLFSIFFNDFIKIDANSYLTTMPFVGLLILLISSLTYKHIEKPMIEVGRKLR